MRVLFDHQIFSEHVYGGVSRYFCSLALALHEKKLVDARIFSPLYVNQYLKDLPTSLRTGYLVKSRPGTRRVIRGLSGGLFRMLSPLVQHDLVHESYYSKHSTNWTHAPRVVTVFDMIHERRPNDFHHNDPIPLAKVAAIKRAEHILCISEFTKRDLVEIHNVAESRITVTHLASDVFRESDVSSRDVLGFVGSYLLYVGGRHGYKNFIALLRAWAITGWLRKNFRLVCFGGGDFSAQESSLMIELGVENEVVYLSGSDVTLSALYRGAAAFVYPSLYEGFGIPPLEAMSLGCPVVCSDVTSIPEVVGDAGEYFDPVRIEALIDALNVVLGSRGRRQQLIDAGYRRSKLFSWEKCASSTEAAYSRVLS